MSGEKTEQPTPKKLREARKKGQVAKSQDLTQSLLFVTAATVLAIGGSLYVAELKALMTGVFQPGMLTGTLTNDQVMRVTGFAWARALLLIAPLLGSLVVIAILTNFLQVKSVFSMDVVKPKLEKLNPVKGFQNIFFKSRTYLELLKTLIKFGITFAVAYYSLRNALPDVLSSTRANPSTSAKLAATLLISLLFKTGMIFVVLGVADFMLQKRMHMKNLKMSKYEVQKEYKEDEGDPHIKHMRKQLHEQMLAGDIAAKVPKASVVVINPTHIAVAIEYRESTMNAPVVTAKGQELLAQRIRDLARTHQVPILREVALARRLFKVELDSEIPEDLYGAVAEVLNWVQTLSQEQNYEESHES
jgi:flagellar biosynthesis protein FlhB